MSQYKDLSDDSRMQQPGSHPLLRSSPPCKLARPINEIQMKAQVEAYCLSYPCLLRSTTANFPFTTKTEGIVQSLSLDPDRDLSTRILEGLVRGKAVSLCTYVRHWSGASNNKSPAEPCRTLQRIRIRSASVNALPWTLRCSALTAQ